jgi:hypothetical protein
LPRSSSRKSDLKISFDFVSFSEVEDLLVLTIELDVIRTDNSAAIAVFFCPLGPHNFTHVSAQLKGSRATNNEQDAPSTRSDLSNNRDNSHSTLAASVGSSITGRQSPPHRHYATQMAAAPATGTAADVAADAAAARRSLSLFISRRSIVDLSFSDRVSLPPQSSRLASAKKDAPD